MAKRQNNNEIIYIGADEVGRGPLAGPVVGSGCLFVGTPKRKLQLSKELISIGVCDSKKLSSKKRLQLLKDFGIDISKVKNGQVYKTESFDLLLCLNELGPEYIDQHNILQSSLTAMNLSIKAFQESLPKRIYQREICFDGNKVPKMKFEGWNYSSLVKGDSKCPFIGLASIFAKEYRDYLMKVISEKYPGYGLEKHAGYPTKAHREAIEKLGVSEVHRKSFKGVKEFVSSEL